MAPAVAATALAARAATLPAYSVSAGALMAAGANTAWVRAFANKDPFPVWAPGTPLPAGNVDPPTHNVPPVAGVAPTAAATGHFARMAEHALTVNWVNDVNICVEQRLNPPLPGAGPAWTYAQGYHWCPALYE